MGMDRLGHLAGTREEVEAMDWAALQRAMMEWADHLRIYVRSHGRTLALHNSDEPDGAASGLLSLCPFFFWGSMGMY